MKAFIHFILLALISCASLTGELRAKENLQNWKPESKRQYLWKLADMLRTEQRERLMRLKKFDPKLAPTLNYPHFPDSTDLKWKERHGEYLEGRMTGEKERAYLHFLSKDLQDNQTKLIAQEVIAKEQWKPEDLENADSLKEHTAEIWGDAITATRIGVVLDNSPSMTPHIARLRTEISQNFPYSTFVETDGCGLQDYWFRLTKDAADSKISAGRLNVPLCRWFFADPPSNLNPFDQCWNAPSKINISEDDYAAWLTMARSTHSALLAMAETVQVDTIYWFSDFQDDAERALVKEVVKRLEKKKVRLYLVSVDDRPASDFVKYARKSKGGFERKRIR